MYSYHLLPFQSGIWHLILYLASSTLYLASGICHPLWYMAYSILYLAFGISSIMYYSPVSRTNFNIWQYTPVAFFSFPLVALPFSTCCTIQIHLLIYSNSTCCYPNPLVDLLQFHLLLSFPFYISLDPLTISSLLIFHYSIT